MSAADPKTACHARPVQSAPPQHTPTPQSGRNARGQFAPGNAGGPGRPPKVQYIEREIIAIMASALTAEVWLEISQAVIAKAREGNMTAVQWLSKTFLTGKLNEAAAAQEVRVPPHIEMYELGKKQHREWSYFMDEKRREAEEMGLDWPPEDAAQDEDVAADAAPTGEEEELLEDTPDPRPLTPDPCLDELLEDEEDEGLEEEEEEDEEDLYHGPSATYALQQQTQLGQTTGLPAMPQLPCRPLTAAEADRIRGYSLTAGVAPFNGPNRSNTAENAGLSGPGPAR